jgi:hypothetical protein
MARSAIQQKNNVDSTRGKDGSHVLNDRYSKDSPGYFTTQATELLGKKLSRKTAKAKKSPVIGRR